MGFHIVSSDKTNFHSSNLSFRARSGDALHRRFCFYKNDRPGAGGAGTGGYFFSGMREMNTRELMSRR